MIGTTKKMGLLGVIGLLLSNLSFSQVNTVTQDLIEEMLKEKTRSASTSDHLDTKSDDRSDFEESGAEPFIAINPNNEDQIGIIYMENVATRHLFLSEDGGDTWEESPLNPETILSELYPEHTIIGGGDPILIFDNDNNIHAAWIYLHGTDLGDPYNNTMETFYVISSDFGATWEVQSSVHSGLLSSFDAIDRIWIDADHSGGERNNNVYLSAVHFLASDTGPAGQVVFSKSEASESFSEIGVGAIAPGPGGQTQYGNIAVDDMGNVHVSAAILRGETEQVVYSRSTDGAETFSSHLVISDGILITSEAESNIHGRENVATSLATDGENVYVAWNEIKDGVTRGYYVFSHDNGITFSDPIEFASDINEFIYATAMPCIAADDDYLAISWYMFDQITLETRYMSAYSNDAGVTLTALETLSEESTDFNSLPSTQFYGDYNDSDMSGCHAHFTWSDGRTGTPRIYHSKVDACTIGSGEVSLSEYTPITENLKIENLFPSPATGNDLVLSISSNKARSLNLVMYSQSGEIVERLSSFTLLSGENKLDLNVSAYASGSYMILGETEDGYIFSRKWVKN